MAVKLGYRRWALAVIASGLIGCVGLPAVDGAYESRAVEARAPEFAVVLRNVALMKADVNFVAYEEEDMQEIRKNLQRAIEQDLYASGPFRKPKVGEAAHDLDVWIDFLWVRDNRSSGLGLFHVFAPDGTLVYEERLGTLEQYGRRHRAEERTIGEAAAPLLQKFKRSVVAKRERMLARTPLKMITGGGAYRHARAYGLPYHDLAWGRWYGRDGVEVHEDGSPVIRLEDQRRAEAAQVVLAGGPVPALAVDLAPALAPALDPALDPAPALAVQVDAAAEWLSVSPQPATYVLTIGIDRYREAPAAEGAEADARRVDEFFARSFNVPQKHRRLLLGDRATRTDIEQGLRWLASESRRGGRAFMYFSGHGAPDADTGRAYLVPYEADPADLTNTALALADVERQLAKLPTRDVVLIVDACFSGQGARSIASKGARPLVFVEPQAQVIRLAAASLRESASATAGGDGGLFTHYLLAGLGTGRADVDGDGQITVAELGSWLIPRVSAAARGRGRTQTPSFSVGAREEVVLGWGYPIE